MQITKESTDEMQLYSYYSHIGNWKNYLCNLGSRLEYEQIAQKSKSAMFAIMKYRRLLRCRGLGNVSFIALNMAYTTKNYIKLHELLQELFLEVIGKKQFEYILNILDNTESGLEKLYDRHTQDKNLRILSIILIL